MDQDLNIPVKKVLREDIKRYLINAILRGDYKPGERLVETQIARDINVSQAPVREAIRDMEQMGILTSEPYRGASVRNFSIKDLRDIYDLRAEVEALAIRSAVPYLEEQEISAIESVLGQMDAAAEAGNIELMVSLDVRFHELIVKASRNQFVEQTWRTASIEFWTLLGTYQYKHDKGCLSGRHQPILEAIRNRDAEEAEKQIKTHFLELKNMLKD